jgi:hypothetical protein
VDRWDSKRVDNRSSKYARKQWLNCISRKFSVQKMCITDLLKIEEHVAQEGEIREQPSGQEINAPTVPSTKTGKE